MKAKILNTKKGWQSGSSGRAPAWPSVRPWVQIPVPHTHRKSQTVSKWRKIFQIECDLRAEEQLITVVNSNNNSTRLTLTWHLLKAKGVFCFVFEMVLVCSPGWPWIHYPAWPSKCWDCSHLHIWCQVLLSTFHLHFNFNEVRSHNVVIISILHVKKLRHTEAEVTCPRGWISKLGLLSMQLLLMLTTISTFMMGQVSRISSKILYLHGLDSQRHNSETSLSLPLAQSHKCKASSTSST
jgi:hypothetical protein